MGCRVRVALATAPHCFVDPSIMEASSSTCPSAFRTAPAPGIEDRVVFHHPDGRFHGIEAASPGYQDFLTRLEGLLQAFVLGEVARGISGGRRGARPPVNSNGVTLRWFLRVEARGGEKEKEKGRGFHCPDDDSEGGPEQGYGDSLIRIRRYSTWPRSPSSPIGPEAGTFMAASRTSPLQVQWATVPLTVTTNSFQS